MIVKVKTTTTIMITMKTLRLSPSMHQSGLTTLPISITAICMRMPKILTIHTTKQRIQRPFRHSKLQIQHLLLMGIIKGHQQLVLVEQIHLPLKVYQ